MPQAEKTVVITVVQRDQETKATQGGNRRLGVKTAAGKWIQVVGADVNNISVGHELVITEPRPFGKQAFAELRAIRLAQSSNGQDKTPAPSPAQQHFQPPMAKLSWDEFSRTVRAAYMLINECEPDEYTEVELSDNGTETGPRPVVRVDRSQARASVVCSIIIALTKDGGRIDPASETEGKASVPF